MLTGEEIEKHNNRQSCWIVIHSSVYDITGNLAKVWTRISD